MLPYGYPQAATVGVFVDAGSRDEDGLFVVSLARCLLFLSLTGHALLSMYV